MDYTLEYRISVAVGALAGFSAGLAAQIDIRSLAGASGVAVAVFIEAVWGFAGFEWLQKHLPIARRVAGAWCLAIALLLGALAIRVSAQ